MKDPIILQRGDCLRPWQALHWKDLLYRTVKIGTELEFAVKQGSPKNEILTELTNLLQPSGDLNQLGPLGVLDVQSEHCGIEIRVIGRQPYYQSLLGQYGEILKIVRQFDLRTHFTCGLHYHLIAIGLSELMPEIILANFWNLIRRYAPNLKFLTSTGNKREALCRRRNHNSHLEMVQQTPVASQMQEIQRQLKLSKKVPEHQNFCNLEHLRFSPEGEISKLHLELRFCDADFAPTSIVAKTFLFLALLLKSVEISQFGVIHVGRLQEWRRNTELLNLLSNNAGTLAASDTSRITDEIIDELRIGSRELLELVKPVFARFENNPGFEILSFLAENPISLLRCSGYNWEEIENLLAHQIRGKIPEFDKLDLKLIKCIELGILSNIDSFAEWKKNAAWEFFSDVSQIEERLSKYKRWRGLKWDAGIGTCVFLH